MIVPSMLGVLASILSAPPAAPVNSVAPVVTGTGYVGYTLSTTTGTWLNSPTSYTYQWQRNSVNIGGATSSTYLMTLEDEGIPIRCVITAINGSGSSTANSNSIEQWVPTDAGASPTHWYDAFASTTITLVGSTVSAWANKGTIGSSLIQNTASLQPVYNSVGLDGYPTISFVSSDALNKGTADIAGQNVSGLLIGVMARPSTVSGSHRIFCIMGTGSGNTRALLRIDNGSLQTSGRRLNGDSFAFVGFGTSVVNTKQMALSCFNYASAQAFGSYNGVESTPSAFQTAGNTSDTASQVQQLGSLSSATEFFFGDMSEVIQYNILPNSTNRAKLAGYYAWRWRAVTELDSSSPFKSTPPTP